MPKGAELANRRRRYFEVQLRFASLAGAQLGVPLSDMVLTHTNFHRRLGLGAPDLHGTHPGWRTFVAALSECADLDERLAVTVQHYAESPEEPFPPRETLFGCFNFSAPEAGGVARIHFVNRDATDGVGPLSHLKQARRAGELKAAIIRLLERHPETRFIRGRSWLFHRHAYRRLFPVAHVESMDIVRGSITFDGSSNWGQFLSSFGANPDLCDQFVENLGQLDMAEPWRAYPLPALETVTGIDVFKRHFRIA